MTFVLDEDGRIKKHLRNAGWAALTISAVTFPDERPDAVTEDRRSKENGPACRSVTIVD